MAKKKFYSVRKGLVPGIYTSWEECQQNIENFPGAEYKGFQTKEEAEAFLSFDENYKSDGIERLYSTSDAIAYVDGCFNETTNEYSYGVVLFYDGGEEHLSEKFSDPEMAKMRNVAGELEGAKKAIKFCYDNGIKSVEIFYDYEGIEKWCTGAWRTKKPGTKEYKQFYNQLKDAVSIQFSKVAAHSGNQYNDLADALAKAALGLIDETSNLIAKDSGVVANEIKKGDLESILDLMKEDFSDIKISIENIPYGSRYILSIESPNKQRLIINSYESKNKLWISGRKEDLFNRLVMYIVELLEIEEIPEFLNTVHEIKIDKEVVETEFERLFPNAKDKLPKGVNKYLHQAVFNLHVDGCPYVANYLVEPALRPLEAVLKIALKENGIPIRDEEQNHDSFFVFKEKDGSYRLKEQYVLENHSEKFLKYLGKCYTYFCQNRHTLFHWDDPTEDVDTTRILNTVAEAVVIIRDAIALIDEYYAL